MLTLNTILEELNDVPVDKLRELHDINSLKINNHATQSLKKENRLRYRSLFSFKKVINKTQSASLSF